MNGVVTMKKKKVLIVVHHLTIGGVQKSVVSALHAMDYDKYDITLYLQKNRTVLLPYIDKRVKVIVNNDKRHYYRLMYSILLQIIIAVLTFFNKEEQAEKHRKKLSDYIRCKMMSNEQKEYFKNDNYDVAVAYNGGVEALFVSEYISANCKIACFQSSTIEYSDFQYTILPKFDRIVVEDKCIEDMLTENIPNLDGKITVIANYVDVDFIEEQSREKDINVPGDKIVICSVGRQAYVKGFDLAVEAAGILKAQGIDFIWYLVGDGPETENIKKIIRENGLDNEVIMAGMQINPYTYIKKCDIFVQPSREEAMSIAALESQVLNKPLVTTKTVGGMNICKDGETGIMTDISAEGLANGIARLIADPELCHKISENLSKIDYDIEKERYKNQWNRVLS